MNTEDKEVNNPHGIIIFGANGSGKTTLGREVARILNFKHMDIEDYHFEKSEIPYTVERSREECLALLLTDIERFTTFVLSAVTGDFGDIIPQYYKLGVLISAPLDLRLERIKQRELERHGTRVHECGDMYKQQLKFIDFVTHRDLSRIDEWAETLSCPIIRVDGTIDLQVNAVSISEKWRVINDR